MVNLTLSGEHNDEYEIHDDRGTGTRCCYSTRGGRAGRVHTVQHYRSRFFEPAGGNVRQIDDSFIDPASIRWGQDGIAIEETSGYEFDAATPPNVVEPVDTIFGLGSFTHFNNPITAGTSITGVSFEVTGNISLVDDDNNVSIVGPRTFAFDILHNETTNSGPLSSCVEQPSLSVCDDAVTISTAMGTDTFEVNGDSFTLDILGFSTDLDAASNGIFTEKFLSPEGGSNERILAATFTQNISPVPLPAAGWMLLAGIGGLAALRRRKKA